MLTADRFCMHCSVCRLTTNCQQRDGAKCVSAVAAVVDATAVDAVAVAIAPAVDAVA